jgi:hypothetical protein
MLRTILPPRRGFWRVARGPNPLAPPTPVPPADSKNVGNRFDSPTGDYSVIYFGTHLEACFMETLARLRPAPGLREVVQTEWREAGFMEVGAVPADWRQRRLAVRAMPPNDPPFLDVEAAESLQVLRDEVADVLDQYDYEDLDIGLIRGPDRRVTRAISQWAYEQTNETGEYALFAGIRYCSRQGPDLECWAVFDDINFVELERRPITLDMPALRKVAKVYDLQLH